MANFFCEASILENAGFNIESDATQPSGTGAMVRPERICVVAPGAPKRADAAQRQSVNGIVNDMIYAGPMRKYRVRVGSSVLFVREHVDSRRRIVRPGDEVRLEWLRPDLRFVAR
ncbi:ABC-type Fe3+/spermidine/putrescine transport system ATPase subunit [Bradyrhizobium sp. USDA 4518]